MAAKGPSMDLSSFQDIMTCILGILILIILLTGIDASQITVLVATPKEDSADDKTPAFFECRHNQLFFISLKELGEICDKKTEALKDLAQGNESEFLKQAAQSILSYNGFNLDYTYALMGRYVLTPEPEAEGYKMENYPTEDETMWFGSKLAALNPETAFICFFVRPDSFKIFQMARGIAWLKGFNVACELQDPANPIIIGPGGERVLQQ